MSHKQRDEAEEHKRISRILDSLPGSSRTVCKPVSFGWGLEKVDKNTYRNAEFYCDMAEEVIRKGRQLRAIKNGVNPDLTEKEEYNGEETKEG